MSITAAPGKQARRSKVNEERGMWKRSALAGMLCGALVAVTWGQAATQPLVLEPPPHEIAVVGTWDQLGQQPALETRVGAMQLGLSAAATQSHGVVLLYARMDTVLPRPTPTPGVVPQVPTVDVHLKSESGEERNFSIAAKRGDAPSQPQLLVIPMLLDQPGSYAVEVVEEKQVIARATVIASKSEAERWLPLSGPNPTATQPAPRLSVAFVPATPICASGWQDPPADTLPAALPTEPSKEFQIAMAGDQIQVAHWPADVLRPSEQLLVCFFANGKRLEPAPPIANFPGGRERFAPPPYDGPFSFGMSVDLGSLGVGPDDTLEMQLLCSPAGYALWGLGPRRTFPGSKLPVLSNRVPIHIVPGKQGGAAK